MRDPREDVAMSAGRGANVCAITSQNLALMHEWVAGRT